MYKTYRVSDAKVASYLLYMGCKLLKHYIADGETKRIAFEFEDYMDREDLQRAYYNMTDITRVIAKKLFHSHMDIINLIIEAQRNYENEKVKENVNADKRPDII